MEGRESERWMYSTRSDSQGVPPGKGEATIGAAHTCFGSTSRKCRGEVLQPHIHADAFVRSFSRSSPVDWVSILSDLDAERSQCVGNELLRTNQFLLNLTGPPFDIGCFYHQISPRPSSRPSLDYL